MNTTTHYNLNKPEINDYYDVDNFNDNADIIDANLYTAVRRSEQAVRPFANSVSCNGTIEAGATVTDSHYEQIYSESWYQPGTAIFIKIWTVGNKSYNKKPVLIGKVGETLKLYKYGTNTELFSIALNTNGFTVTNVSEASASISIEVGLANIYEITGN